MVFSNPYQTYQKQAITTSKPEELTLMLYQGMVKFIRLSKTALQKNNLEESHSYNLRAQDVVSELMVTLKKDYTISDSFYLLYEYLKYRLIDANIHKKLDILEEVESYALELADAWSTAIKQRQTNN